MGVIKRLKNPNRVLVCLCGDELMDQVACVVAGEFFRGDQFLQFVAEAKLKQKEVDIPKGAVKIQFDKPSGEYQILFMEPGDMG